MKTPWDSPLPELEVEMLCAQKHGPVGLYLQVRFDARAGSVYATTMRRPPTEICGGSWTYLDMWQLWDFRVESDWHYQRVLSWLREGLLQVHRVRRPEENWS